MKLLLKIIILAQFIWIGNIYALSCKSPDIQFVVKCQNDICTDGFFLFRKSRDSACSSMLDVVDSDPIYKLTNDFSTIKSNNEILNGFYKIDQKKDLSIRRDYVKSLSKCFSENSNNIVTTSCFEKGTKFTPLEYEAQNTIDYVKNDFVEKSNFENLLTEILKYLLPVLMVFFVGLSLRYNDSKHIGKIMTVIFILILITIPDMLLSGWPSWARSGVLGFLYFVGFMIFLLCRYVWRYHQRQKSKNT